MIRNTKHIFLTLLVMLGSTLLAQEKSQQTFVAGNNREFLLNGKPFLIRAAELHYPRIPREYWEHRIQMSKAMGMNTICIYLFWNLHEQKEGVYDFSGQKDIVEFVKLVQKNGMYCIVRPGPYVCAEWDMGGLPWWLLKKKDISVRSKDDPFFMSSLKRYLNKTISLLAPYQIQNGGNIIMAQVENEYGVWGSDAQYMSNIRDLIRSSGFDKVQLFRCDWASNFDKYTVDGVASTLNFGAGANITDQFKKFKQVYPESPLMCSEYWTGWFDQWGRPHSSSGVKSFIGSLKDMMDQRISFSLYMAHGGTSFGQWSGANAPPYRPNISSYDYDAPISESGLPTEKFYAIRDLLKNYLNAGETLAAIPPMPVKTITVPKIEMQLTASLFDNLPAPKSSKEIMPMEFLDQGWGRIMYSSTIGPINGRAKLIITEPHDWVAVYINKKLIGTIDRRLNQKSLILPAIAQNAKLDLLVEATGRVNYGKAIIDRKGITEKVEIETDFGKNKISDWQIYSFPVDYAFQKAKKYKKAKAHNAAWYRSTFQLKETGDTFLDMSTWGKGMVWVNGHNIGRFWDIGPSQTMYMPGAWLKKGKNEIIVFDLKQPEKAVVQGLNKPILSMLKPDESILHRKPGEDLLLKDAEPIAQGLLPNESGWQTIVLDKARKGRYFVIEACSAQDKNDTVASLAEIEITGTDGNPLSTLHWNVLYADSEDLLSGSTADKLFDAQETVMWQTNLYNKNAAHPHRVLIDLGENVTVKSIKVLPRRDNLKTGMIKEYKIYLQETPFIIEKK